MKDWMPKRKERKSVLVYIECYRIERERERKMDNIMTDNRMSCVNEKGRYN